MILFPNSILEGPNSASGWIGVGDFGELSFVSPADLISRVRARRQEALYRRSSAIREYHRHVTDFPFIDYSSPRAARDEASLLDRYAKIAPPPSPLTSYAGPPFVLSELVPEFRILLEIVSLVTDPIAYQATRHGPLIRRRVPSGGSRHPVEPAVTIHLRERDLHVAWDSNHHEYRLIDSDVGPPTNSEIATCHGVTLDIRLEISRATWRYRDPRSSRAVFLDAGHYLEAVSGSLLEADVKHRIDYLGLDTSFVNIDSPVVATLSVPHRMNPRSDNSKKVPRAREKYSGWNPYSFVDLSSGRLYGHTTWPSRSSVDLSDHVNAIAFLGGMERIKGSNLPPALVSSGLFIDSCTAETRMRHVRPWSSHGWYLPMLSLLEYYGSEGSEGPVQSRSQQLLSESSLAALSNRRTFRNFTGARILPDQVYSVLVSARIGLRFEVRCLLLANSSGDRILLKWDPSAGGTTTGDVMKKSTFDQLVVRQPTIARAACVVLVRAVPDSDEEYFPCLIELGRAMQRLVLAATQMGYGLLTTPAVTDSIANDNFDGAESGLAVTYAVGIEKFRQHED